MSEEEIVLDRIDNAGTILHSVLISLVVYCKKKIGEVNNQEEKEVIDKVKEGTYSLFDSGLCQGEAIGEALRLIGLVVPLVRKYPPIGLGSNANFWIVIKNISTASGCLNEVVSKTLIRDESRAAHWTKEYMSRLKERLKCVMEDNTKHKLPFLVSTLELYLLDICIYVEFITSALEDK